MKKQTYGYYKHGAGPYFRIWFDEEGLPDNAHYWCADEQCFKQDDSLILDEMRGAPVREISEEAFTAAIAGE